MNAMPKDGTYRATVLAAINRSDRFLTGAEIAAISQLSYKQTIDVLYALHNEDLVLREGAKVTAKWGSLALAKPEPNAGAHDLETAFRAFFRR
jgi:hypothetical protein